MFKENYVNNLPILPTAFNMVLIRMNLLLGIMFTDPKNKKQIKITNIFDISHSPYKNI